MAVPHFIPQHQTNRYCNHSIPFPFSCPKTPSLFTINTKLRFQNSIEPPNIRHKCFYISNSTSADDFLAPNISHSTEGKEDGDLRIEFLDNFKRWVHSIRSILPGGSWWDLGDSSETAKPVTVFLALRRIWELVSDDRWVIYTAFASLTIVALSDISMPNLLAESVFSAQNGEIAVFYKNLRFLLLLCFTSGIFSGIRRGCFGMANMILLKRLRETLFTAIIFQDISFFDIEAVGDLTSRLGADCQRLSNVIGNDMHSILRNVIQGIGALIHLLTLSWPLALSTLVICSVLSIIFLVYGQLLRRLFL